MMLWVPVVIGLCGLGGVFWWARARVRRLGAAVAEVPRRLGPALGFVAPSDAVLPEWWLGELGGRTVGVTAVTAQVSGHDNQKSTVVVLRLAAGLRAEVAWNFRYHFSRPRPKDTDAVFEKHPEVPEAVRFASLEFLARRTGLYIGPGRKLQNDPPTALAGLVAHDTLETSLSSEEAMVRLRALVALAEVVDPRTD